MITDDCIEWDGRLTAKGYPVEGRSAYVHRAVWEEVHGRSLVPGELVCHHCDNPPCINPDHLFVGSAQDNSDDMVRKGRARNGGLRGSDHGMAILTEAEVIKIKADPRLHQRGGQTVLAREYGVSAAVIHKIACGKNWAWL